MKTLYNTRDDWFNQSSRKDNPSCAMKTSYMSWVNTAAFLVVFGLTIQTASAQTINVHTGSVNTMFAATADDMTFTDGGTSLTIQGKIFSVADIDSIVVNESGVAESSVHVGYAGTQSAVTVSGEVAPYLTVSVDGAHVRILQSESLAQEVSYILDGTSSNGSFWMDGSLKATLVFNGLDLTCADSAAVNIRNGKRIAVILTDSTVNTLRDGAAGDQKACLAIKGHAEFKGAGTLNLYGNAKHAYSSNEYTLLKKTTGTINILSAQKDGMNIGQYFEMKGGCVNISGVGDDGIQVSKTDDTDDEFNGQAFFRGGSISAQITAQAGKGVKVEDTLYVSSTVMDITTSGGGMYDSSDLDVSGSAAIKGDAAICISGGTLTLRSTGTGGKGISCDADITVDGGTVNVTTTGKQYTYNRLTALPKGIKADGNITVNAGDISVTCTGGEGSEGIESKNTLTINGGTVVAKTYDDGLNASSKISITGGKVYVCSTGNDAIDSNGTLSVSGGLVLASGTREPEAGFDCDQNTFAITGGTVIGLGGDSSKPTASVTTQPVYLCGRQTLTQNQTLVLKDASGNVIWSFVVPQSYTQGATILFSSPSISVGSSYTLVSGATVSGGTTWQGYSDDASVSGGGTLRTFTQSSTVTSVGTSSSGGGGFRPGGRW